MQEKKYGFKSKIFSTKNPESESESELEPEPKPAVFPTHKRRARESTYKDFFDKIAHDKAKINIEVFIEYFKY